MARLHLLLTVLWALLAVPAVLWWSESVLFVVLASIYSNLVGHWGAFEAARAEEKLGRDHPSQVCRYPCEGEVRV